MKIIRIFYSPFFLLLILFGCSNKGDKLPNIILILADDLGYNDLTIYRDLKPGGSPVRLPSSGTPNIDRLAAQGLRFTDFYAGASVCSPSRASLLTGRNATRVGVYNWIPENSPMHLRDTEVTIAELLKGANYKTGHFGKWHLGDAMTDRFDFIASGDAFRESYSDGETINIFTPDGSGCHLWLPALNHRPDNKPFFLWLAANDPHRPYSEGIISRPHTPDEVIVPPYLPDTPDVRRDLALNYDEVSRLDNYLGKIIAEIESQGIEENTIILFISDNGRPFPRDKTTIYDGGIKTPFVLQWPAIVKAGTLSDSMVSAVDIAPTFLKIAGIEPGDNFVGRDFSPILIDPDKEIREYIFAQAHWHDHERMYRAVRDKRYKYIRNFFPDLPNTPPADALTSLTFRSMLELKDKGKLNEAQMNVFIVPTPKEELYDTENDPYELHNLALDPAFADVLESKCRILRRYMDSTNDHIPETRTPDEYDRRTGEPFPNRNGSGKANLINNSQIIE